MQDSFMRDSLMQDGLMQKSVSPSGLVDRFGRGVNYLRVSITDRCDFRCVYCMAEDMRFLPRSEVLSLEEIAFVCRAFVELGVEKIRITGGEPLVRQGVLSLLQQVGALPGLRELTMTTNGSQLPRMAADVRAAGVRRLNISLDTLNPAKFKAMTRTGDIEQVLMGINAARAAGFERIKLNAVILKGFNHDEAADLVGFAVERDLDISFIEEMPLGEVSGHDRELCFYPSQRIREDLQGRFSLTPTEESSGGPSRYYRVEGARTRVGFISPHSENFCASCNRVRLTVAGRLLLCLGNEDSVDLKALLREYPGDMPRLKQALIDAMVLKPERHQFNIYEQPVIFRHMSMTGG